MAKRKNKNLEIVEEPIEEKIFEQPLEEVMSDRYASYAKYVIQDRALPDVRDGLKPVQRRIIYAMYLEGNTFNKPRRKCAHSVGAVMGKYHPHGDTSIYEALVRMAQDWKVRVPLIDFQGNKGSIDGDGPAAYRYTEARLEEITNEMIRDIDKETVDMQFTFDDAELEPVVLPAHFPNLLVNGSEGIAVALATEIPTHNLKEVIDATIYRINHPNCSIASLRNYILGPDFSTGGIIYKSDGLDEIYETGRGRIEIAAKAEIIKKGDVSQIVITEIPYKVIKIELVYAIDKIRSSKVIDGINEVRDESDLDGIRIVIDLKKNAKPDIILNYLMNKTNLLTSYSANMVAIVDNRPRTLNLAEILDAYIAHQIDVTTRRIKFDLAKQERRLHIVEGLITAILNIHEVVNIIEKSKDKSDSKKNLMIAFNLSDEQAEAVVTLPLYRLSNSDVNVFIKEKEDLTASIAELKSILSDENKLHNTIIKDLRTISNKYATPRKTMIAEKGETKTIDKRDLIAKEDVIVVLTRDGYIKRSSLKSYRSSGDNALPGVKEGDVIIALGVASTLDYILAFTNFGNYLLVPVHEINENKYKDEGKHINYLINLPFQEKIIRAFVIANFRNDVNVVLASKHGQIKKTSLSSFYVNKCNRPLTAMRLLSGDELVEVSMTNGDYDIVLFTSLGNGTFYDEKEISTTGLKSGGVKSISSLRGDEIAGMLTFEKGERKKILLLSKEGCIRFFDLNYLKKTNRLGRVQQVFRCFKSDIHHLIFVDKLNSFRGNETYHLDYLNTNNNLLSYDVSDFSLWPVDKNSKKNMNLPTKSYITSVFQLKLDKVDEKTPSQNIVLNSSDEEELLPLEEMAREAIEEEKSSEENSPSNEENNEEEKRYEQLSIFDDFDN